MRERLKRVVLKTTVRETVPGVRIPLPPPLTRLMRKQLVILTERLAWSFLGHLEHKWSTVGLRTAASSLRSHPAMRF